VILEFSYEIKNCKSFWGTSKYRDFEKDQPADKVIFNMFICHYKSPKINYSLFKLFLLTINGLDSGVEI